MKKYLKALMVLFVIAIAGSVSAEEKASSKTAVVEQYHQLLGVTGDSSTIKPMIEKIRTVITAPDSKIVRLHITSKNEDYWQVAVEGYLVRVDDKSGAVTIVSVHSANILNGKVVGYLTNEYTEVTSDADGRITQGNLASSIDMLKKKPIFTLASRGTEIEPWWTVQLEVSAKSVLALIQK